MHISVQEEDVRLMKVMQIRGG